MPSDSIPFLDTNDVKFQSWAADGTELGADFEIEGPREGQRVGMWQLGVVTYTYTAQADQTYYVLEGNIGLEVEGVGKGEFGPGEAFYIRQDQFFRWENREPARLFFVLVGSEERLQAISRGDVPDILAIESSG